MTQRFWLTDVIFETVEQMHQFTEFVSDNVAPGIMREERKIKEPKSKPEDELWHQILMSKNYGE